MTTKEISFNIPNALYGSGKGKAMVIWLNDKERQGLMEMYNDNNVDEDERSLLFVIADRIRKASPANKEFPDEIWSTIVYEREYPLFVDMMAFHLVNHGQMYVK